MTRMYADAYLHAMGDQFVDQGLAEHGITFVQYLEMPELARARQCGQRLIEPMRHHRYSESTDRRRNARGR